MFKFIFFSAALFVLCQSCGSRDVDVVYDSQKPEAYSFEDFKAKCFTCHGTGAYPKIPSDEAGFKASAKVKAEIEGGDMPPKKDGFDKAKALAFFAEKKEPIKDSGGYER